MQIQWVTAAECPSDQSGRLQSINALGVAIIATMFNIGLICNKYAFNAVQCGGGILFTYQLSSWSLQSPKQSRLIEEGTWSLITANQRTEIKDASSLKQLTELRDFTNHFQVSPDAFFYSSYTSFCQRFNIFYFLFAFQTLNQNFRFA